jgi:TRAP-type mannitol/chloroaromatic compound transport system permease large subunit
MEWWLVIIIFLAGLGILLASGLPVAFSFFLVNLVGAVVIIGSEAGLRQLIISMVSSITIFTLVPIPMFILMGEILFHSGIAVNVLDVLDKWLGRLPGRLSLLAVGSGTLFSTLSGSTLANPAMLGTMLAPDMKRRGYGKALTLGPIMASGGLAMIIPPSALAVVLASLARII